MPRLRLRLISLGLWSLGAAAAGQRAAAALATGVTGFYYTGESTTTLTAMGQGANTPSVNNSGQADAPWQVTYASTNGGSSAATAYEGTSYVINTTNSSYTGASQYPSPPWAANTTQAEWITAPGAQWENTSQSTATGGVNAGGDGLPGYGSDSSPVAFNSSHAVVYVYTTTFTITSTAGIGTAITGLTLNLKVAADNNYAIFVNPTGGGAKFLATSTANYISAPDAYTASPTPVALTSGFVVGVNTLSVEVQNAGGTSSYSTNYSGVLVYGAGFVGVAERGGWLPLVTAAACYGVWMWQRRRRADGSASPA